MSDESDFEIMSSQPEKQVFSSAPEDIIFKFKVQPLVGSLRKFGYRLKEGTNLPYTSFTGGKILTKLNFFKLLSLTRISHQILNFPRAFSCWIQMRVDRQQMGDDGRI